MLYSLMIVCMVKNTLTQYLPSHLKVKTNGNLRKSPFADDYKTPNYPKKIMVLYNYIQYSTVLYI